MSADDIQRYTEGIALLTEAGRLGTVLFQYPASFIRESENIVNLETALGGLAKLAKVVELRHRSWSEHKAETDALLERLRATRAYVDEPKFLTFVKQELTATGALTYVRLHGRNQEKWWKHDNAWQRYIAFIKPGIFAALRNA